jgi:hypothetical protein
MQPVRLAGALAARIGRQRRGLGPGGRAGRRPGDQQSGWGRRSGRRQRCPEIVLSAALGEGPPRSRGTGVRFPPPPLDHRHVARERRGVRRFTQRLSTPGALEPRRRRLWCTAVAQCCPRAVRCCHPRRGLGRTVRPQRNPLRVRVLRVVPALRRRSRPPACSPAPQPEPAAKRDSPARNRSRAAGASRADAPSRRPQRSPAARARAPG